MADNQQQPMITVKKSDGSLVKMTMDEFHVYKASLDGKHVDPNASQGISLQPNEVVTPQLAPSLNLPMVEETMALASETPVIVGETIHEFEQVNKVPVNEEMPVEEENLEAHASVSGGTLNIVDEIVQSISFLVGESEQERLKSLVLSRVKEIRTDAQVQEFATEPIATGGLGLEQSKVAILQNAIEHSLLARAVASPLASAKQMMNPVVPSQAASVRASLPGIIPSKIVLDKKVDGQKILSSLIASDAAEAQMKARITGKVIMHDVVVPQKTMGPIDEMQAYSLIDFRRVGANPQVSADALIHKFDLLKNESYLLFLQGRAAWLKSPLYEMYLFIMEQSLSQKKDIAFILTQNKNGLTMQDIEEVARVSQSLNF